MRLKISKRLRQQLLQKAIAGSPYDDGITAGEFLTKREMKKLLLSYLDAVAFDRQEMMGKEGA